MIVGVVKESYPGERRVALVPAVVPALGDGGVEVVLEAGAGEEAGFPDAEYAAKGASILSARAEVFQKADVICQVRTLGANPDAGKADLQLLRRGQTLIGFADPLIAAGPVKEMADAGLTLLAMELMPRITRAQSMDALSSQATIQGYKAVLVAADILPRMFPMMMTAAGTLAPTRMFIIGAGVAGLQAIATARRLGAVVDAFDIRPVVKEQVESLGAKFLVVDLQMQGAQDASGYAKAMDEATNLKQQELMTLAVADSDVVITTAAVPGRKSPVLVTGEMVAGMAPGSVIVDLAAERGGNCQLTRADETVVEHGVTIVGPTNLPATVPYHASQMYAKNISTFLLHLTSEGKLKLDMEDEITQQTLITKSGEVVHRRVRELVGLDEPVAAAETPETSEASAS
ncbi:MAG: Re/Si-specific NAD(P)(+) transhydrogenase subunit alpha [Planctomycetes bacterium]|nr:Re/Si-specific NAD(P)(+) transhydrogenase subunit alpha [Planctomycetota bacterium]